MDCDAKVVAVIVLRECSDRDRAMAGPNRDIVIVDFRGALIDWSPSHLCRKLFAGDDVALEIQGLYFRTREAGADLVALGLFP